MYKTKGVNKKIILVVVVIVAVAVTLLIGFMNVSFDVTEYLADGQSMTSIIKGLGSRLTVDLTSMNGNMDVKIVVDGQAVIENWGINNFNFKHDMGFGYHIVQVIIQNPTILGLGSTIQVSGKVSASLW